MLVFTTGAESSGAAPQWRALRLDAKRALPIEDFVVVAGRFVPNAAPRQLTCLGGRVKPVRARLLLVLPLPATHAGATSDSSPPIQVLEVGECAVRLLRDVKACFPSLVRKNPLAHDDDDSDDSDDSDDAAGTGPSRTRRKEEDANRVAAVAHAAAQPRGPSPDAAAFLAATRVRVLPSMAALREAYAFEGDALVRAVERDVNESTATAASSPQFLCLEFPADAPTDQHASPELNFGVVFAHASHHTAQFLEIPLPREPRGFFRNDGDEEEDHMAFQDATVFTIGSKRESSEHGGGKTVDETVKNIRLRHASGTFCTLVLPPLTWGKVMATFRAALPQLQALQGSELRARRFMGVVPNRAVTILLETN